jgi:hypothetical protein
VREDIGEEGAAVREPDNALSTHAKLLAVKSPSAARPATRCAGSPPILTAKINFVNDLVKKPLILVIAGLGFEPL